jgi:hypothetical protein
LGEVVQMLYEKVGTYHAREAMRGLKMTKGFGFNEIWVNFILDYFKQHLVQYITFGSVKTMRDYFLPIISKAINEGTPFDELAREIEQSGFEKWQAARIVRTEVNSAASLGTIAAGKSYEYETNKEWISAHDSRVRGKNPEDHADHFHLDGQVVDYNEYFIDPKNGVKLMQPGDARAVGMPKDRAATTINCRCTVALVARRDAAGRLIPKSGFKFEEEVIEYKDEVDFSEINEHLEYLNEDLRDASRAIRSLKDSDTELLETMERKITDQKHELKIITTTKDELMELFQQEMNVYSVKADELIELIGLKSEPVVNIDNGEFSNEVQRLNNELVPRINAVKQFVETHKNDLNVLSLQLFALINLRFDELMKEMRRKKEYQFTVLRGKDDLIISATAKEV